ncbi:MAG: hypothetical protein SYC29_16685 [Planctomycetota bacterium]|nr:hypothetical protein [Planctomycetota bacterium]
MNEHEATPQTTTPAPEGDATPDATGETYETAGQHDEKLVPVSEARRYRKRAQAAETTLSDLQHELSAQQAVVREQQELISDLQRRQQIDEQLIEAGAVDLETARLLADLSIGEMDEPDVGEAIEDLRRRKPFLFRHTPGGSGALSPRETGESPVDDRLTDAASEACRSGRRQDLLRYLHLRRQK